MTDRVTKDIIVIGGSAGSSAVLKRLVRDLPPDLPASVFISTHMPAHAPSLLADILASGASLPVAQAVDGQSIERGRVYVAAPDRHLLLIGDTIRLGAGPRENMARPAIDPLFRSAALSGGPRTVGVVLSGMLNDGASGLHAIKAVGGTAVVQHPIDAASDQMPLAALQAAEVDHVVPAADLGALLRAIAETPAGPGLAPTDDLRLEVDIAAGARLGSASLRWFATPSALSCPDCQGVMSEVNNGRPLRFRCQIGHAHTAETLAADIADIGGAIHVAMRMVEERVTLVERMALDARATGRPAVAELFDARLDEYRRYADTLRQAAITSMRLGGTPLDPGA